MKIGSSGKYPEAIRPRMHCAERQKGGMGLYTVSQLPTGHHFKFDFLILWFVFLIVYSYMQVHMSLQIALYFTIYTVTCIPGPGPGPAQ